MFLFDVPVARRKNSSDSREARAGWAEARSVFEASRDGRAAEAAYGGADPGEASGMKLFAHLPLINVSLAPSAMS